MAQRTVSVVVVSLALLIVLWLAPHVLLAVFAGILAAVFLRCGGNWIAMRLKVGAGTGLAFFSGAPVIAADAAPRSSGPDAISPAAAVAR